MAARGEFSSRTAFVLAASGSAIGLGNIWGFPIKVASNGGGAFVFTYIILTFLLAYPILMAELVIGRYAKSDTVRSVNAVSTPGFRPLAFLTGYWGMLTASLILSFYAIVAGWMVSHGIGAVAELLGQSQTWFVADSVARSILFSAVFYVLTIAIVANGVASGIEKWSTRLMPVLILLIIALIIYIAMQPGAAEGWRVYLQPDFSKVLEPGLVVDALSQAFFSLSLGVGTMMIYGSYVSKSENLPKLGATVAGMDIGIAVLAGMLVIPAMYVAQHNGVVIYDDAGNLIESGRLIFNVLPSLFDTMGGAGAVVAMLFFALMSIAALTSSISMLEVPVAYASESRGIQRKKAAWLVGSGIFAFSLVIIFNAAWLFDWVVRIATEFSEPLIGILFCVFVGWVWQRDKLLQELKQGSPHVERTLFWKIWPTYVKFVCPLIVIGLLIRSFG
ncbi:sodium-dependent transporter [Arenicella chitinivorans]|uniref:Sodium-dependent transporter n=1 Tax=Arenicella chitinivorans TaxID=1329800 RepID=A0A918VQD9_9GAMM|nr:sodium-dependent transporter [Arenicella chitinivorans]GHA15382.1 sodium-dependent transporter [Arenicella chitinivorans]